MKHDPQIVSGPTGASTGMVRSTDPLDAAVEASWHGVSSGFFAHGVPDHSRKKSARAVLQAALDAGTIEFVQPPSESLPGVYEAWALHEATNRGPFWTELQTAVARVAVLEQEVAAARSDALRQEQLSASQQQLVARREAERDEADQALWDVYAILGFDTDGDKTPAASVAGMGHTAYCDSIRLDAREFRAQYDEALGEVRP